MAIGIRNIGIMELRMWTGKPKPIINPIVDTTVTVATIIGRMMSAHLRKNRKRRPKITSMVNAQRSTH
jgi:hypothetical protein